MENKTPPSEIRDWAHLPTVAVQLISEKFKSITDFVRFRAVCSPWRSASLPKPLHLPPQLPWLMIPYHPDPHKKGSKPREDDGIRLFYDLWQSKMHKLHLPETIGKICWATGRGWLILANIRGTEVFLLNPLTRAHIQLPPFAAPVKIFGPEQENCHDAASYWFGPYIGCTISKLSFSTDLTDPNCLVIVFLQITGLIFFCRVGDPCWTMVNMQPEEIQTGNVAVATYHEGRFFMLSCDGVMRTCNLNNPKKRVVFSVHPKLQFVRKLFLEGKSGVYVVVIRRDEEGEEEEVGEAAASRDDVPHDAEDTEKGPRQKIELYQFLEQQLGLQQVMDTRDTIIFYGVNSHCLSVSTGDWNSLAGGCMYMEEICASSAGKSEGELCFGISVVKLDNGRSELLVGDLGERLQHWLAGPAIWLQPSFV